MATRSPRKNGRQKLIDTATMPIFPDTVAYDDAEDFLDAVASDYGELTPDPNGWFPTEYVVFYTGPRGSSKTLQLARHSLIALAQNEKVFTNLELYPEKAGIKAQPQPLGLEFLLSFDETLTDAVIVISEIDTWVDRMREMSTGNRLVGKFLQQLRKKGLRIFFDTQDYLPGGLMRQVDKLVYCHDFFFTEWGRDRNIRKGTTFYYDCMDYSGNFTGHKGKVWKEALYHAERIWPFYNTLKIHDPMEFARRVKIVGGERVFDLDAGEVYPADEAALRSYERNVRADNISVRNILESVPFQELMGLAGKVGAISELPDRYVFSAHKLRKGIANLKGAGKDHLNTAYTELLDLATQGRIAAFGPRHETIEFTKPRLDIDQQEADYE